MRIGLHVSGGAGENGVEWRTDRCAPGDGDGVLKWTLGVNQVGRTGIGQWLALGC